jgi:uncharacterized protein (DUF1810 family)
MWYIFPQLAGLAPNPSPMSKLYAIRDVQEAKEYLQHSVLGPRLVEISNALLNLESNDAEEIFGFVDAKKFKSCMSLFSSVEGADEVFGKVLGKFFTRKFCCVEFWRVIRKMSLH